MSDNATPANNEALPRQGHYPVLDALRFILAFWVVVAHFEMPPLFGNPHGGAGLLYWFRRAWDTAVFGTPAVIVFFVISGFCIHLPFRGSAEINVARYYLRRYTRILIPVAAALFVYRFVGQRLILWGEHSILWESPLWSLACEEIYYAMYPLLRWVRNIAGWKLLLPASFAISVPIAATHLHAANWHVFGPFGTAMLLLPVWLLGCLLAEQAESLAPGKLRVSIWWWRLAIWLACRIAGLMHFKMGISYTQTMVWFGVLAYFWVRQEIAYGKTSSPNRYLVAAGAWSYSLYLVHPAGGTMFGWLGLPSLGGVTDWFLVMTSCLTFAYVFYVLVERPSHKLARKISIKGSRGAIPSGKEMGTILPEMTPPSKEVAGS
jgi:peptidoglycan/LPS O-acetylase OafA/YrhL